MKQNSIESLIWNPNNGTFELMPISFQNVNISILDSGFHSKFQVSLTNGSFLFLFRTTNEWFFDKFELERQFGTESRLFGYSDLELPSFAPKAEPHLLLLRLNSTNTIPFHLRYQEPNPMGIHSLSIHTPTVFYCPNHCPFTHDLYEIASSGCQLNFLNQSEWTLQIPTGYSTDATVVEHVTFWLILFGLIITLKNV